MLLADLTLHIPVYLLVNSYIGARGVSFNVAIPWDEHVPFIKYLAPFYACAYFLPVVSYFLCWKNYELLKAAFKAFLGAALICLFSFILFPVEFTLRAKLAPPYDTFDQIVRFFYWADNPPYNCFPSLHVAVAFLSARLVSLYRRSWSVGFYLLATMITLAAIFIRQHFLVDIGAGFLIYYLLRVLFLPDELLLDLKAREPLMQV